MFDPTVNGNWMGVTFGSGIFVAVTYEGEIYHSNDGGVSWLSKAAMPGNQWRRVAFGKGMFVAVAETGKIAHSSDGKTWSLNPNPPNGAWRVVTYGSAGVSSIEEVKFR
jgi:photosystem II stability/assembly factor-like uncharacterized protein